jgi:hypothetical protein
MDNRKANNLLFQILRLSRFYETLIRTTLKTSFEEFKGRISELESVRPEEYFKVSHQLR